MLEGVVMFSDGELVGRVKEFGTKEAFLKAIREQWPNYVIDSPEDVQIRLCRFYRCPPAEMWSEDFSGGAYVIDPPCGRTRGTFEVFVLDPITTWVRKNRMRCI